MPLYWPRREKNGRQIRFGKNISVLRVTLNNAESQNIFTVSVADARCKLKYIYPKKLYDGALGGHQLN